MATVLMVGRVGTKPDMRYTTNGRQFWLFRAVDVVDRVYQKDVEPIEKWFDCIFFPRDEKDGAQFGSMVEVGSLVFLQGTLSPKRPYTGHDGVCKLEYQVKVDKWRVLLFPPKKEEEIKTRDSEKQPEQRKDNKSNDLPPKESGNSAQTSLFDEKEKEGNNDDDLPF